MIHRIPEKSDFPCVMLDAEYLLSKVWAAQENRFLLFIIFQIVLR